MKTFQQQVERGGGKVSTFPNKDLEHTVRMPCEPCNNGWMSELENEVKLFVTDMAFRGRRLYWTKLVSARSCVGP